MHLYMISKNCGLTRSSLIIIAFVSQSDAVGNSYYYNPEYKYQSCLHWNEKKKNGNKCSHHPCAQRQDCICISSYKNWHLEKARKDLVYSIKLWKYIKNPTNECINLTLNQKESIQINNTSCHLVMFTSAALSMWQCVR